MRFPVGREGRENLLNAPGLILVGDSSGEYFGLAAADINCLIVFAAGKGFLT